MSRVRHVHVITPGDHFSPRTGSAIPTVVHGLCSSTPEGEPRPAVVVRRDTYRDRYDSADIIEYDAATAFPVLDARARKYLDAGLGALGLPRPTVRHELAAVVRGQDAWEPSVVFAHNAPQLVPLIDARRHVPVLYAHNHLLRSYSTREAARILDRVAVIIAVSEALAEQTISHLPLRLRRRVRVVHNGVDVEAFGSGERRPRSGPMRVAFVGRMIRDKGADVVVDALVRLGRADIHLTLVGSSGFSDTDPLSAYEIDVRSRAAALGDRVDVLPFMPPHEVQRVLGAADVVVVPSRWAEPFALTALEGMAAGAAVVASDIGGIPETVAGTGILVPPADVDALAAALEALADDEDLRRRTAEACVMYARQHDWAAAAAELEGVMQGWSE